LVLNDKNDHKDSKVEKDRQVQDSSRTA
jgi:hypothetical protein